MNNRTEELAATALRMARARRMRLDAKKVLNVRGHTDEERKQALADLDMARRWHAAHYQPVISITREQAEAMGLKP